MGASLPPAEDVAARRRRLAATVTTARKTHGLNCTCTTTYSMEPGADGVVIIHFACFQWTTVNCRLNLSCLILIFSFSFTLYSTSCFLLRRTLLCLSLHSASVPIWPRPESAPTPYGPFAPRKSSTPYSPFASHGSFAQLLRPRLFRTAFASAPLLGCLFELHGVVNRGTATYTYNPSLYLNLYLNLYLRFIHISRRLAHLLGGERRSSRLEAAGYVLYFDVKGRV